jgi:hypothetical protein
MLDSGIDNNASASMIFYFFQTILHEDVFDCEHAYGVAPSRLYLTIEGSSETSQEDDEVDKAVKVG